MTHLNWTDWHLTPQGWVAGTSSIDGVADHVGPPGARVLSYRFRMNPMLPSGRMEMIFSAKNAAMVREIESRFGECPARIVRASRQGESA